jgi:LmbE family N-acetylglucosaminyl deacetylase
VIRVAGVFAHPDDDVYLLGGTLLLHRGEVDPTFVFATNGGAGPISSPELATRETLGTVREAEQRAALEAIGYGDAPVHFLGHPDYYLPDVPREQLVAEIEALLQKVQPHVVVTFGPEGLTSHHDHMAVGAATTDAFHRARKTSERSREGVFSRLYHVALARSDVDRFYAGVRDGGYGYGEEGRLFDVTGVDDDAISVRVDTRSVQDRKLAGILAHRTQLVEWERVPVPLRWIYLDAECFVQAYPSGRPGGNVRADLLGDLRARDGDE